MIERHFHWYFYGFDEYTEDGKNVMWPVDVEVIGYLAEADAKIAVEDILPRKHYHLRKVWECASCGYQKENAETLKAMVKAMS